MQARAFWWQSGAVLPSQPIAATLDYQPQFAMGLPSSRCASARGGITLFHRHPADSCYATHCANSAYAPFAVPLTYDTARLCDTQEPKILDLDELANHETSVPTYENTFRLLKLRILGTE
jgi:hypothetical protein